MSERVKTLLTLGLPILLTIIVSYAIQGTILANQAEFTRWLSRFGPYIFLVYAILQTIAIIIAPIGGFFLVVAMIAIFGPEIALLSNYLVATPVYFINFFLARKYGRPFVQKIIGKEPLEKMDHIIKDAGVFILIITKVLQGGNFDFLSYGWGLTKIPLKTFAIVNIIGGIPSFFLTLFIFTRFGNLLYGVVTFYIVTIIFAAVAIYLVHHLKKHQRF